MKSGESYEGKHWMQDPKNKVKMMQLIKKMKAGKRRAEHQNKHQQFKSMARRIKRRTVKYIAEQKKTASLVLNGWRIVLADNEVRIERE